MIQNGWIENGIIPFDEAYGFVHQERAVDLGGYFERSVFGLSASMDAVKTNENNFDDTLN